MNELNPDYRKMVTEMKIEEDASEEGHIIPNLSTAPYTPTPKLPDFFAPKPMSGALTYTPTTEEVAKSYVWFRDQAFTDDKLRAEFDRWLAEVKADAVIELVARIEAAVILLGDDDITPTGRRMISKVLNPYRQGEE